jgi:uncharacterized membrane protein
MSDIKSSERFVRWQGVLREHITFLNNLLITIGVAIIGGLIALLEDKSFLPKGCEKIFFTTGLFLTIVSIMIGLIVALIRLHDFRLTTNKIKAELNKSAKDNLDEMKEIMDFVGRATWKAFDFQVYVLLLASLSLSIAFLMIYNDKLF